MAKVLRAGLGPSHPLRLLAISLLALLASACTTDPVEAPAGPPDASGGMPDGGTDTKLDAPAEDGPGPAPGTVAVLVAPGSGIVTSERGTQATFTVVLSAVPTADVTIAVSSGDPSEGTVTPAMLRFSPSNALAPQTVTVMGIDDPEEDGDVTYRVMLGGAVSNDARFAGLDVPDMPVTNIDDESAGISVLAGGGLRTTEHGGEVSFAVVLNSKPKANVTLPVASADPSEGTASPAVLTFTEANWNAPQMVTVVGVNDPDHDGDVAYMITLGPSASSDADYQGISPPGPTIENVDDETPGLLVEGTNLRTTEAGGQTTFTVVLRTRPGADVTLSVAVTDASEGTVSPATLVFTPVNWNAPRTITVTGVNDDVADGNQIYRVNMGPAQSLDPDYIGVAAASAPIANTDDDSAGISVVVADTPLFTSEAGTQATFTVALASRPTANVTIGLASSDTSEGTVAPAALTFTPDNWNAPQTVTVAGVNDPFADGNQPYAIVTAPAVSSDDNYDGLDVANVVMANSDDDSAGFVVSSISGTLTEAGGTAIFTVALSSQPSANVTIGVASSDPGEATAAPASLTFTPENWNAPQTVTVTGVEDDLADGNQAFSIVTAPAVSSDTTGYNGLDPRNVAVVTVDDDSAGFLVGAISGHTSEAGATATFTVALTSQPSANVVVALSTSDATEGTVLPASLTFTAANWNAPQTVTVTGVDDATADGNQVFAIVTAAAASSDDGYDGLDPANVGVTNTDNDTAGFTVGTISGSTSEAGATATFTIALTSQPSANVVVGLSSNDTGEGTVAPASLTFTSVNWNAPQTVTVTGVNDALADGNQPFTIVTAAAGSADGGYNGLDPANVSVTNTDNDTAGFSVGVISGNTSEAGATATFTIALTSQPGADVTIGLTSSDSTEGTVSPASLTFTSVNWNAPQTVTVTGVNDALADGNQPFTIVTAAAGSADGGYNGLDPANVSVTNTDNDTAGFTVGTISGSTDEGGATATFTIALTSQPTGDVTIGLSSSDTTEGTVLPASLTFTAMNWNVAQTVTVTGVNDALADGNQPYTIVTAAAVSSDAGYNGSDPANVSVTNTDNDTAGFTVGTISGVTTEAGGTATFTIVLTSQPTADVSVGLTSNDTTEGTVLPALLTFTAMNWNVAQTVTVKGVNDALADGNQPFTIVTAAATSSDSGYNGLDPANVSVTNDDDDSAGTTVGTISGATTEAGGTATFTVVLTSQPSADVTIGLTSSDTTEGTVLPASLTFTSMNWNVAQTVTVTGVNDSTNDGDQSYSIVTAAAVSADAGYNNRNAADVTVSNTDDDLYNVVVGSISGATTEAGGTATFTLVLNFAPTADVTIGLSSNDTTEGTVSPASVTFTTMNWSTPQTVTVTGVNDMLADGNLTYTIVTAAATSTDANWAGINPADVTVTNRDDDSITVSPTSGVSTAEDGSTATFTVVLARAPAADVTLPVVSNDTTEGTVSPASLTFTSANWSTPQTVTVTGVDDMTSDAAIAYTVSVGAATSTDATYAGHLAVAVSLTNHPVGNIAMVTVGANSNTCALTTAGKAYCWGSNNHGELGTNDQMARNTPTAVAGPARIFRSIRRGEYVSCGVTTSDELFCWGIHNDGALGLGSMTTSSLTPSSVSTGYASVSTGPTFTCGLDTNGAAHCWGDNNYYQLGLGGPTANFSNPQPVADAHVFMQLCTGGDFACGLESGGDAYCWGNYAYGQIGDGVSGGGYEFPTKVAGGHAFAEITCLDTTACARTSAGATYCWGNNLYGTLATGSNTPSSIDSPMGISGYTFAKLASPAGSSHMCALTSNGTAYCWGRNNHGQLGNNQTSAYSATPVAVSGGLSFSQISTGDTHTCGVAYGQLYCWGQNQDGQLGLGNTTSSSVPVLVTFPP